MIKKLDPQNWSVEALQQLHELYKKTQAVVYKPHQVSETWIWDQIRKESPASIIVEVIPMPEQPLSAVGVYQ